MLTRSQAIPIAYTLSAVMCTWLVHTSTANAQKSPTASTSRALHKPIRLTAGLSNQWMGAYAPAHDALYFVSDRNATREIFVQKPVDSGPRLLFESDADVSWPRPSPDGTRLAYISHRTDATGDLCVMRVRSRERTCLSGAGSTEMQPVWMDGGRSLGALLRTELHGNYQLRVFDPKASKVSQGRLLIERNMLGVSVSRDGRWLAYVPVEPTERQVGVAFANRSGQALMFQRLDGSRAVSNTGDQAAAIAFDPGLPGLTGFPAFSLDGTHLYFSQYLNDTNSDGAINGDDHSVLFRVPFDVDAEDPVAAHRPQQLTSAQWNCRYPVPSDKRLIMTCAHQDSLDIYALPLSGAVPDDWDEARVLGEVHVARNHWTKLLLYAHLAARAGTDQQKHLDIARRMTWLHIELREYESANFHAREAIRLAKMGKKRAHDALWADVMVELGRHRQADVKLTHGQLSDQYVTSEKKRIDRLRALAPSSRDVVSLIALVRSEIQADIGDKARERALFDSVRPQNIDDPLVLEVYAQRAHTVHALRGDRSALLSVYSALADHDAFDTLTRLRYAEAFVAELFRGVPERERASRVDVWLARVSPDSELTLMLRIASWLLQLNDERQEDVRAGIFELYKQNKQPDRRRALVLATVRTAARLGNEYLQYQFATSFASWLSRAEPERKHAEELYRKIVLERAYTELDKDELAKARASFYAATVQTLSLEAHIGFIETRVDEGLSDEQLRETYAKRFAKNPEDPAYAFVKAYLIARALPEMDPSPAANAAYRTATDAAIAELAKAARVWPRSMEISHVWGTVLHRRARRLASKNDAIDAHAHYLLALDLARDNVRFQASLHVQIGLLQAELGNHRIALRHFTERARLPHSIPSRELSLRVAMARSAYHTDRHALAVEQTTRALALVDAHSHLDKYRPLVLDRLAFYKQAAGKSAAALPHYQALIPLVDASSSNDVGAPINRLKARLGAAVAALAAKEYAVAVQRIEEIEPIVSGTASLRDQRPLVGITPTERARLARDDYRLLLTGLLAHAHRGMENFDQARPAMQRRYRMIKKRFDKGESDDDLLEMARISYHLAEYAFRSGDKPRTRTLLERGLRHSDAFNKETGSDVNPVGLRLIQAYAELHLYGQVPLSRYDLDLPKRLRTDYDFICTYRSPNWQADRFLFSLYLAMLEISR